MVDPRVIRIGTRDSKLALAQTSWVAAALAQRFPSLQAETVCIKTKGDQIVDKPLDSSLGKGFFVKEIEEQMLAGHIDIAVHSLKDLPTELPEGLTLAALCKRIEARDAVVLPSVEQDVSLASGNAELNLSVLPKNARVGTSSLRRQAQLRYSQPSLKLKPLRGNVDTRLRKLDDGGYDAIVVAAAGLIRLGLSKRIGFLLPLSICVPAAGQGALAIEARRDDLMTLEILAHLDDPRVRAEATAERATVSEFNAGCHSAFGVYATSGNKKMSIHAAVASLDGGLVLREFVSGSGCEAEALGRTLAGRLFDRGAAKLLEG